MQAHNAQAADRRPTRRRAPGPALLLFLSLLFSGAAVTRASAHAVFIYARPDGERICTESWFSKKVRVQGGEVSMEDAQGKLLANGVTDEAGVVCFPVPAGGGDLRFIVRAGQGHRAEFLLPATVGAAPAERPEVPAGASRSGAASEKAGDNPAYGIVPAPSGSDGPALRDIIGGAGWLVGLAGIGAFAASRRKRD
ncbi:MAG: hypothetical protein LBQ51_04040 [Desulfovibrio sp.]|jgi:nickel transport protein|nr:hypothetical protein [Desulfovibrio sp.]